MHKNKKCGFSLAEAMITILIIGILALLSVPVAKKIVKKDSNPNKGTWMATRNSRGEAVYWKKGMGNKDNPDKWTKCNTTCQINGQAVSDCCVFDSPLNVRNFSLTAVGAGGGGGGASIELKKYLDSFRVPSTGYYRMLAIGGGGAGALWNCNRDWLQNAGGGGAGALGYAEFNLDENVNYVYYTTGKGGTNCDYYGSGGSGSIIKLEYTNGTEEEIIKASGGGGGEGRWKTGLGLNCNNDLGKGGSAGSIYISSKGENKKQAQRGGCYYCNGSAQPARLDAAISREVNERLGYNAITSIGTNTQPGTGGLPQNHSSASASKCQGKNGLVVATAKLIAAGIGGEAGNAADEFVPKFDTGQVVVYIGKGGKGGQTGSTVIEEDADALGQDGGDTYVGSKIYTGGKGGGHKNIVAETSTPGGNGSGSPIPSRTAPSVIYGGLSDKDGNLDTQRGVNGEKAGGYGAGGGGGGVLVDRANAKAEGGYGGDGAPGYVQITW